MNYDNEYSKRLFNMNRLTITSFFKSHSPFSQWYDSKFSDGENTYHNCEQYMMAHKALLFKDYTTYKKIMQTTNPRDIKKLGREVKNFDQKIWDCHKFNIVRDGNYLKFSQNEDLLNILLSTKGTALVEASPYDKIWGVGLDEFNPDINNPYKWKGQNLLGYALMYVRDRFDKSYCNIYQLYHIFYDIFGFTMNKNHLDEVNLFQYMVYLLKELNIIKCDYRFEYCDRYGMTSSELRNNIDGLEEYIDLDEIDRPEVDTLKIKELLNVDYSPYHKTYWFEALCLIHYLLQKDKYALKEEVLDYLRIHSYDERLTNEEINEKAHILIKEYINCSDLKSIEF